MLVYSFSDGKVTHPIIDCAYGVGGCVYYEYAPYKSTLRSFGHDMEEYGNTIYSIKDNMLTTLYEERGFYESTETKYINYTDESLSDEELKDRIEELYGGKITVVQLVLTIPNPIDFVKNHDKICI